MRKNASARRDNPHTVTTRNFNLLVDIHTYIPPTELTKRNVPISLDINVDILHVVLLKRTNSRELSVTAILLR